MISIEIRNSISDDNIRGEAKITMYKIGEFSSIVNISIRTLRYYDEYGVLKPSEIDRFSGYRYYTDEDIVECELIKLLKSVEFTLDEIIHHKENITDDILEKKQHEIEEKIKLLRLKHERLSLMRYELKNGGKVYTRKRNKKVLRRDLK